MTKDTARIEHLQSLAGAAQCDYALRLLTTTKNLEVLQAALDVLMAEPDPRARHAILDAYADCTSSGKRRDPGCHMRVALLSASGQVLQRQDRDILEQAVCTYEFLPPGPVEVATQLRAVALIALNEIDETLAGYHAVHLLTHMHTSHMSGEPAVTAARVLASQGATSVLYAYVLRDDPGTSEVFGECLRHLTDLPASLLTPLVERYLDSRDEIVLLGLFDLLIAREADASYDDVIFAFLSETRLYNIYRYLVNTIVVSRQDGLRQRLQALATREKDKTKAEILHQALALRRT